MIKDKVVKAAKDDSAIEQLPDNDSTSQIIPVVNNGEAHEITDDNDPEIIAPEKEREDKDHHHEYKVPVGDKTPVPEKQKPTLKQNMSAESLKKQGSYNEKNPVSKDNAKIKK